MKTNKLRIFDVCSGIGGFSLGLEATENFETVAFCEADKWCQKVLKKHFSGIPIYDDLIQLSKDEEAIRTIQKQTSTQQGFHVSPSQLQDSKKERKTLDTSGRTCLKLLSTKDPLMSLSKMLVASSMWHSTRCALSWRVKATPQGRLYFGYTSQCPTKEIESGVSERTLWATPQLTDGTRDQKPRAKEDPTEAAKQRGCSNLREQVHENFWRTPTTMDAKGDALKHATKLLQGKTKRASGEQYR